MQVQLKCGWFLWDLHGLKCLFPGEELLLIRVEKAAAGSTVDTYRQVPFAKNVAFVRNI